MSISLKDMLKQHVEKSNDSHQEKSNNSHQEKSNNSYQVRIQNDPAGVYIVRVNDNQPSVCIFEKNIKNFCCSFIQYVVTNDDIKSLNCPMIGYLVKKNDINICMLTLYFESTEKITNSTICNGIFKIILSNSKNEKKIINTYDTYNGHDNMLKELTDVLCCVLDDINDDIEK